MPDLKTTQKELASFQIQALKRFNELEKENKELKTTVLTQGKFIADLQIDKEQTERQFKILHEELEDLAMTLEVTITDVEQLQPEKKKSIFSWRLWKRKL